MDTNHQQPGLALMYNGTITILFTDGIHNISDINVSCHASNGHSLFQGLLPSNLKLHSIYVTVGWVFWLVLVVRMIPILVMPKILLSFAIKCKIIS